MAAFTVRIPETEARKLDALASKLERSRAWIAARAIEDYVAREAWQIEEIQAGLAEAERGEFASEKELARIKAKYIKPRRNT